MAKEKPFAYYGVHVEKGYGLYCPDCWQTDTIAEEEAAGLLPGDSLTALFRVRPLCGVCSKEIVPPEPSEADIRDVLAAQRKEGRECGGCTR